MGSDRGLGWKWKDNGYPALHLAGRPRRRFDGPLGGNSVPEDETKEFGELLRTNRCSSPSPSGLGWDLAAAGPRGSRLELRFVPASRSRRRTSRMTWERMALRALTSLILLEVRSSS